MEYCKKWATHSASGLLRSRELWVLIVIGLSLSDRGMSLDPSDWRVEFDGRNWVHWTIVTLTVVLLPQLAGRPKTGT